jgi:hypothetical protein
VDVKHCTINLQVWWNMYSTRNIAMEEKKDWREVAKTKWG